HGGIPPARRETSIRSGPAPGTLLLLQVSDGRLPVFEPPEADHLADAEVLQEHPQHDEARSLAGKNPVYIFNLLRGLGDPLIELLIRPAATLSANVPFDGFHRIAPLTITHGQRPRFSRLRSILVNDHGDRDSGRASPDQGMMEAGHAAVCQAIPLGGTRMQPG